MVETVAPGFVTPQRGVQIPPVVSIVGTGRPLSEGIQLHHNRDKYGFFLNKEIEGFGLAPFENTTLPRASGGATLRHRRTAEGSMFLPLTLVSPSPSSMYDMMAWLVDTVTGQGGFFDVVFFDPYSQEARRRTVLYDSGLETVNEQIPDFKHIVGVTGTFLSPFWRGPERVVTERIAPPVKPLITADPGSPVNRWDDTEFTDSTAYEPWFVVDGGLEKQGTGAQHGVWVAGHDIEVSPGETISVSADLSYVDGPEVGHTTLIARALDETGSTLAETVVFSEQYPGTHTGTAVMPEDGVTVRLGFFTESDVHANTRVRLTNLTVHRGALMGTTYEWAGTPHASESIKKIDGVEVARNLFPMPSFEDSNLSWSAKAANINPTLYSGDAHIGTRSLQIEDQTGSSGYQLVSWDFDIPSSGGFLAVKVHSKRRAGSAWLGVRLGYHSGGWQYSGPDWRTISSIEWRETSGIAFQFPPGVTQGRVSFYISSDGAYGAPAAGTRVLVDGVRVAVGDTEADALDKVATYWDGDTEDELDVDATEGAYSFPFFPVFLADSTVQGEHELRVEGDAPVWPVWEITGPGRDVEIIGPDGSRIFVEGEVSSPITIVTEPGKRSIRDASGLIWDRMKPGDDQFFALEPGEQTVRMTMVGGNPESTIKAVYSENWKTPRGTAQGMIRGGVV